MALSRGNILKHAGVFTTKEVHVPAWADENGDDAVLVRGMTLSEFEVNQARVARADGEGSGHATASLVVRCVVDETGGRLFTDADIETVSQLGFAQVNLIAEAIGDLSGLGADAEGEIAKNLPAAPSGNSSSESPATSEE